MSRVLPKKDSFSLIRSIVKEEKDLALYCDVLEQIIENAPDGIYINDGQANAVLINKAFERISGLKREELIGRNHADLIKDGIIARSVAIEAIQQRKTITLVHTYPTKRQALVTGTPIFDDNGRIIMIINSCRDLTELNNLQAKYDEEVGLRQRYEKQLEEIMDAASKDDSLIVKDEKMVRVIMLANKMAKVESNVMLTGESGVGKDVIARYIHDNSTDNKGPFIAVNCGALPENLIESELFGYEAGAFTGARKTGKAGLIEAASGGTLFLDEVGELPLVMQVRLLRCINNKAIVRVGGTEEIPVQVRIISATNKNLKEMIQEKQFREDLYYRLCVVPVEIPPLRERPGDILPLAEYYLDYYNKRYETGKKLSHSASRLLYSYQWPGNVRELKNVIERVVVTCETEMVMAEDLPINEEITKISIFGDQKVNMKEQLERIEYEQIVRAYDRYRNVCLAAESLGMTEPTYVRKRKAYTRKYGKQHE